MTSSELRILIRSRYDTAFGISHLISPFKNAAFVSPYFDGDTKKFHWTEVRHVVRTRSVRHSVRYKEYARTRASTWVCKRVISSPLMRCRRDDPRAIYAALSISLSLSVSFFLSSSRESPRTPGSRITSAGPPFGRTGHHDIACFIGA